MISIISSGRDDNYGERFIDRYYTSIFENTKNLKRLDLKYEYLTVEWNPLSNNYLYKNNKLSKLYEGDKNIKNIIVTNSVSVSEGLNTNTFFEYFAKNVGVKQAIYDNILIINSDIILSQELILKIKSLVENDLNPNFYYRSKNRHQIDYDGNLIKIENIYHINDKVFGNYSGDFLLINKKTFTDIGQGYDETNIKHRLTYQTGMDGEILWNLYNKGVQLSILEEPYYHINHGKPHKYDNEYNQIGYNNKTDWGFTKYKKITIKDNIIMIK